MQRHRRILIGEVLYEPCNPRRDECSVPTFQFYATIPDDRQNLVSECFSGIPCFCPFIESEERPHDRSCPSAGAHEAVDERKDALDLRPITVDVSSCQRRVLDRNKHQRPREPRLIISGELPTSV